ncbi:MAG: hypothetical protein GEU91_16100 [Rhizobiales bacterium]|nr:hypothetical protein [Hyphomicrobiales bacterium]
MGGKTVLASARGKQKPEPWNVEERRNVLRKSLEITKAMDEAGLLRKILHEELDRLDTAERALCERLDIPWEMPELHRWALIGYHLAVKEKEFTKRRKRGAPKKARSKNEDLFECVEFGRKMFPGVKDKEIIRAMKALPNKHPSVERLFRAGEPSLAKRVSEARSRKNTLTFNRD